jgi:hypothetical protein
MFLIPKRITSVWNQDCLAAAAKLMSLDPSHSHFGWVSILVDKQCIGHLIARGRSGIESFDGNDFSLGTFPDEHEAIAAIVGRLGHGAA